MTRWMAVFIIFAAVWAQAGDDRRPRPQAGGLCSDAWYRFIDDAVTTRDNQGHGPDIGSDEWKSALEFKLGIRDDPNLPERDSEAWCHRIDQLVREKSPASSQNKEHPDKSKAGAGPAFACDRVEAGSIEEMICNDDELSALDRKLSAIYAAATRKAANEHPPMLKAEQRGWIKGRDDCWKADEKRACVRDAYRLRLAELQARYRLVPGKGPIIYVCDGNPKNEVVATFFETDPPTLIAQRGDAVSFMVLQPSASGSKYQGRNESLWEHGGEAVIAWGYGSPDMRCTLKR